MKKIPRITVNHNENTNKNISININYNLASPKNNFLKENYQTNNKNISQLTSNLKLKKLETKDIHLDKSIIQAKKSQASNINKRKKERILTEDIEDTNQSIEKECEISIKVFKNKKSLNQDLNKVGKKSNLKNTKNTTSLKNKKKTEVAQLQTQIPQTNTHKTAKKIFFDSDYKTLSNKPVVQFNEFREIYKQEKKKRQKSKERSYSRKRAKSQQKLNRKKQFDLNLETSDELLKRLLIKKQDSKESLCKKNISLKAITKKNKLNKSTILNDKSRIEQGFKKRKEKSFLKSRSIEKNFKKKKDISMSGLDQIKKVKKSPPKKRVIVDYQNKFDFEPFIISNFLNTSSISDGIKTSELTSKQHSELKVEPTLDLPKTINSIDLASNIRYIRQLERKQKEQKQKSSSSQRNKLNLIQIERKKFDIMNAAAITIQRWWRQQRKREVINYYNHMFQKNKSIYLTEQDEIYFKSPLDDDPDFDKQFSSNFDHDINFDNQFLEKSRKKSQILNQEKKQDERNKNKNINEFKFEEFQDEEFHEESISSMKPKNIKTKLNQEEQQSQFDINKYQEFVERSIQEEISKDQQVSSESDPKHIKSSIRSSIKNSLEISRNEEFSEFKQKQLQQWNHINKLINNQLNNKNQIDSQTLLQQLMKQSQLNKKWIEQSYEGSNAKKKSGESSPKQIEESSPKGSQSRSSQKSDNYRGLIQEKGIAEKIKKNSQNLKGFLCNTYEFQSYEKNLTKKSQSSRQHFKEGNSSKLEQLMTYQLMNDDDSDRDLNVIIKKGKRSKQKNQLIENYLDCGLRDCGIQQKQIGKYDKSLIFTTSQEIQTSEELRKQQKKSPKQNAITILQQQKCQQSEQKQQDYPADQQNHHNIYNNEWNRLNLEILIKNLSSQEQQNEKISEEKLQKKSIEHEIHQNQEISKIFKTQKNSKQNIYESIFNDLCQEFCMEVKEKYKFERIFNNYGANRASKMGIGRGIKTSFPYIKHYLVKFVEFILKNQEQRKSILKNINSVLGPTSAEMLYYMRIQDYSNYEESSDEDETLLIISLQTFQKFQNAYIQEETQESYRRNQKLLAYSHCWHRAIFQGFNQALDYERPYGTYGKPYTWQIEPKIKNVKVTEANLEKRLNTSVNRILDTTSCLSGIMFQKQDSPFFGSNLLEEYKIQINEDRLSRMLANQLLETQQSWINYNDEITQILMQISHMISERILFEVTVQLKKLKRKRMLMNQF